MQTNAETTELLYSFYMDNEAFPMSLSSFSDADNLRAMFMLSIDIAVNVLRALVDDDNIIKALIRDYCRAELNKLLEAKLQEN